jgi:hypothetical protein
MRRRWGVALRPLHRFCILPCTVAWPYRGLSPFQINARWVGSSSSASDLIRGALSMHDILACALLATVQTVAVGTSGRV